MTAIQADIEQYLLWLGVHNYARTTVADRERYLGYLVRFLEGRGVGNSRDVNYDLLKEYQETLFAHRKVDGLPLSFGTQAQRMIPVQQFFSWLRRNGKIDLSPASDLSMPRPDRRLPEATLSVSEMAAVLSCPDVKRPLGLRDRAVLEVFYSCGLRRSELIDLQMRDVDFDRGTVFVRCGKGAKDRHVPIGERALFWLRLYIELARPGFDLVGTTDVLFLSSVGTPLCPDWLSRKVRRYLAIAGVHKQGEHRRTPSCACRDPPCCWPVNSHGRGALCRASWSARFERPLQPNPRLPRSNSSVDLPVPPASFSAHFAVESTRVECSTWR
jgi:integrase/recombinase XerD